VLSILTPGSGDDHDYCEHTHSNGVREVTIKSFSSCTGIRRPGFQLLSLIPPSSSLPSYSQITHADRPCFLPDQVGVYNRVYLPLAIVTVLYLLFTNIRSAWQRWTATGHSVYGDLKSRLSPGLPSAEFVPNSTTTARRVSDRSVPLTLPSRNSSQHLVGLGHHTANGSPVLRPNRLGSAFGVPETRFARSAPVSPQNSPRLSYSEEAASYSYNQSGLSRTDDEESFLETPSLSRRSSYIYMHGGPDFQTPAVLSHEAPSPSYFLPMPSNANTGLGLSTPTPNFLQSGGQDMRRASSSNLSAIASSQSSAPARPGFQNRRVTMPRMVSTADWSAAAKAKETSIFGLMVDTLAVPGLSRGRDRDWTGLQAAKGFARWLWKGRNGVVMKSWREVMAVAWPPGVVWVMVNALFFLG